MQDNIIEFNGKRYDAITGKLLGKSHHPVDEPLAPPSPARNIDGVVRTGVTSMKPAEKTHHAKTHASHTPAPHHTTKRQPAKTIKPHHPQSAKTLMRRAVHKPKTALKPAIKPQTPAEVMAKPASGLVVKRSVNGIDPVRKQRASHTTKSEAVHRFTVPAPEQHPVLHNPAPVRTPRPAAPAPQRTIQHPPAARSKNDMFEAAIARANSHEQPPHEHHARKHRKKHRFAGFTAAIVAFLVLGGFFAYLNMPKIELKIASINAGFGASMPSYSPTGYELADIKNRPGKVTLSFRSGAKNYQVTQQPSNWTSQTLQDDIIASAGHKTIESNGRTIYLYDGVATWLSGDVRYDLTGNAELDQDEIAAIAAST